MFRNRETSRCGVVGCSSREWGGPTTLRCRHSRIFGCRAMFPPRNGIGKRTLSSQKSKFPKTASSPSATNREPATEFEKTSSRSLRFAKKPFGASRRPENRPWVYTHRGGPRFAHERGCATEDSLRQAQGRRLPRYARYLPPLRF